MSSSYKQRIIISHQQGGVGIDRLTHMNKFAGLSLGYRVLIVDFLAFDVWLCFCESCQPLVTWLFHTKCGASSEVIIGEQYTFTCPLTRVVSWCIVLPNDEHDLRKTGQVSFCREFCPLPSAGLWHASKMSKVMTCQGNRHY